MSVMIKGMKMPKDKPSRIVLNPNGQLFVDHGTWYKEYEAVEIPPHGRLIDADALIKLLDNCMFPSDMVTTRAVSMARNWLIDAPTIIESE